MQLTRDIFHLSMAAIHFKKMMGNSRAMRPLFLTGPLFTWSRRSPTAILEMLHARHLKILYKTPNAKLYKTTTRSSLKAITLRTWRPLLHTLVLWISSGSSYARLLMISTLNMLHKMTCQTLFAMNWTSHATLSTMPGTALCMQNVLSYWEAINI